MLSELLEVRTGCCPRCGWRLSDDWASVLLDEAARADIAQRHLVASLRALDGLPGDLVVLPYPVLRTIGNAVIGTHFATDEELIKDERERLAGLSDEWTRSAPARSERRDKEPLLGRLRRRTRSGWLQAAIARRTIAAMAPYDAAASTAVGPVSWRRERRRR